MPRCGKQSTPPLRAIPPRKRFSQEIQEEIVEPLVANSDQRFVPSPGED